MSDADRKNETPEENPINWEVPEQTTQMAHGTAGSGEPHHVEGGESVDEAERGEFRVQKVLDKLV